MTQSESLGGTLCQDPLRPVWPLQGCPLPKVLLQIPQEDIQVPSDLPQKLLFSGIKVYNPSLGRSVEHGGAAVAADQCRGSDPPDICYEIYKPHVFSLHHTSALE